MMTTTTVMISDDTRQAGVMVTRLNYIRGYTILFSERTCAIPKSICHAPCDSIDIDRRVFEKSPKTCT